MGCDFRMHEWPYMFGDDDTPVDTVFEVTWDGKMYACRADGYGAGFFGVQGNYGNGSVGVRNVSEITYLPGFAPRGPEVNYAF